MGEFERFGQSHAPRAGPATREGESVKESIVSSSYKGERWAGGCRFDLVSLLYALPVIYL